MEALFASGRIVDLVLALMAVEGAAFLWWRRRTGGGIAPVALIAFLVSGVALMLALRAALTGAPWTTVALFLALGGVAHAGDLAVRWQRVRPGRDPSDGRGS